jgi:predicted DNA-binding transcriptional regulator YafY
MANPFAISVKFLSAVNLLSTRQGATIKSLMENLNISRRTAFRLLRALEDLGFPLIESQSRHSIEKTYRLSDSYVLKLPNISILNPCLTGEESELVLSILDLCKRIAELGGISTLNAVREKIKSITLKEGKSNARG